MLTFRKLMANDLVNRAVHTFWQAFVAVFVSGILSVYSGLLSTHSFSDAKTALLSLVVAAIAAALSAVKTILVKQK